MKINFEFDNFYHFVLTKYLTNVKIKSYKAHIAVTDASRCGRRHRDAPDGLKGAQHDGVFFFADALF